MQVPEKNYTIDTILIKLLKAGTTKKYIASFLKQENELHGEIFLFCFLLPRGLITQNAGSCFPLGVGGEKPIDTGSVLRDMFFSDRVVDL